MIFKKIILIIVGAMLSAIKNDDETDYEKYKQLEIRNVPSIKKSDLPSEFCDEAFSIVDEFVRKTRDLNYEILLYFDYSNGKILDCKIGSEANVEMEFNEEELIGKHVASIHNHTKDMYTPPSDRNFGILSREWEEYELIAGCGRLWILKAKIKDKRLCFELRIMSNVLFNISLENATLTHKTKKEIEDKCEEAYGALLSKYINDKNINEIQLTKKDYEDEENDSRI